MDAHRKTMDRKTMDRDMQPHRRDENQPLPRKHGKARPHRPDLDKVSAGAVNETIIGGTKYDL